MMYLKHLVTAATAASLPSASAIYDPDADPIPVGAEPGAATFALALPEAAATPVPPTALAATSGMSISNSIGGEVTETVLIKLSNCDSDVPTGTLIIGFEESCDNDCAVNVMVRLGVAEDAYKHLTSSNMIILRQYSPENLASLSRDGNIDFIECDGVAGIAAEDPKAGGMGAPLVEAPPPASAGVAITTATTALPDPLLVGPTWAAVKYRSADAGGLVGVAEGSVVTFEIEEDGSFDGHAGCNNYFGSFEPGSFGPAAIAASALRSAASPPTSTFVVDGRVGSTLMMCEGIMAQEVAYLANFDGAVTFSVQSGGKEMKMTDEAGNVIAEYALYAPPILGQTWTATRYYSAEEDDLVDVLPGSAVTLEISVDEKLGGLAGCNRYDAAYDDLTTESFALAGALVFTKKFCDRPANVMEQESAYLKNFEGGRRRWAILDDGSLELRDMKSGAVVALYDKGAGKSVDKGADKGADAVFATLYDKGADKSVDKGADKGADAVFATLSASGGAALPMASAAVATVLGLLVLHMS